MSIGFFQKAAVKRYTKNALKVMPFALNNDQKVGVATFTICHGVLGLLTNQKMSDPYYKGNILDEREDIKDYVLEVISKHIGYPTNDLSAFSDQIMNSVDDSTELFRIATELVHSKSALHSKELLEKALTLTSATT